ncbi:hypothetical protein KAS08_02970 [Candidatus Pacearchaeota archaeon]|nr:hypothetical protein [Candidatus Pacearchaeota archaeon]
MKKLEIEKAVLEIWKDKLELIHNNITTKFYTRLGIFGALILFLFQLKILKINSLGIFILILAFVSFIILIHFNKLDGKYVRDVHCDLMKSVRENSILKFKLKDRNRYQQNIFYKRRYKEGIL